MSNWEIAFLSVAVFEFLFFIFAVGGAQWFVSRPKAEARDDKVGSAGRRNESPSESQAAV
jgi:hypothetical protein